MYARMVIGEAISDEQVKEFARIYADSWGPRTDDILRAGLLTLTAQPGTPTLADLPKLLTVPAYRARACDQIDDEVLNGFWSWYDDLSGDIPAEERDPDLAVVRDRKTLALVRDKENWALADRGQYPAKSESVRALIDATGLTGKEVSARHLGFVLGPRLNAAGRVADANDGLRLLLSDDPEEAATLAKRLEGLNVERHAQPGSSSRRRRGIDRPGGPPRYDPRRGAQPYRDGVQAAAHPRGAAGPGAVPSGAPAPGSDGRFRSRASSRS